MAARSGFSISIVAPHFAHRVLALGRSPSLDSSNLYRAWQAGQTMIIRPLLSSPTTPEHNPNDGRDGLSWRLKGGRVDRQHSLWSREELDDDEVEDAVDDDAGLVADDEDEKDEDEEEEEEADDDDDLEDDEEEDDDDDDE